MSTRNENNSQLINMPSK